MYNNLSTFFKMIEFIYRLVLTTVGSTRLVGSGTRLPSKKTNEPPSLMPQQTDCFGFNQRGAG